MLRVSEIAPELTGHGLPLSKCEAYNRVYATNRVEIITLVERRRRWTPPEKVRMVEETFEPGMTVSLVARRHGVAPNQLFTWRRLGCARQPDRGRQWGRGRAGF